MVEIGDVWLWEWDLRVRTSGYVVRVFGCVEVFDAVWSGWQMCWSSDVVGEVKVNSLPLILSHNSSGRVLQTTGIVNVDPLLYE